MYISALQPVCVCVCMCVCVCVGVCDGLCGRGEFPNIIISIVTEIDNRLAKYKLLALTFWITPALGRFVDPEPPAPPPTAHNTPSPPSPLQKQLLPHRRTMTRQTGVGFRVSGHRLVASGRTIVSSYTFVINMCKLRINEKIYTSGRTYYRSTRLSHILKIGRPKQIERKTQCTMWRGLCCGLDHLGQQVLLNAHSYICTHLWTLS